MLHEQYMDDSKVKETILAAVDSKYDKREGTLVDAIASSVAPSIANLFINLAIDHDESFADTASYYNLSRKIKERGLTLYPATNAVFKVIVMPNDLEIPAGTRLQLENNENLIYEVVSKIDNETVDNVEYAAFEAKLQETGSEYNSIISGRLLFIDNDVTGCTSINLHSLITAGEDMEEEENARNRYFESFEDKRFGGNIADYKSTISEIAGVGGCRVYRPGEWNQETGYNIKCTCVSSTNSAISSELVASVQNTIYPVINGNGRGTAPIGHKVKIVSVAEVPINLELELEYYDGYTFSNVKDGIETSIDTFLKTLAGTWKDDDPQNSHPPLIVKISNLSSKIIGVEGISDITSIKINSCVINTNLTLGPDDIPVIGIISEAVSE